MGLGKSEMLPYNLQGLNKCRILCIVENDVGLNEGDRNGEVTLLMR